MVICSWVRTQSCFEGTAQNFLITNHCSPQADYYCCSAVGLLALYRLI